MRGFARFCILICMSFVCGLYFHKAQQYIGMRNQQDGVDYYAEVHTSFWNSCVHTIFMPLTMLGMFIWIPALFNLSSVGALWLKCIVSSWYLGFYARISIPNAIVVLVVYSFPFVWSGELYNQLKQRQRLIYGLSVAVVALVCQEFLGHYWGNDQPSRLEAIPNAILYAVYYSESHFW